MGGKIKAEAGLLLPRMTRQHRAPLLWLVLPFCGGLIAARFSLPISRPAALDLGLAAALGAIAAACGQTRSARRLWAGSLLGALAGAGFTVGRDAANQRQSAASRSFAPGMQAVAVQIVHLGPPRPQGPQLRSVTGLGHLVRPGPARAGASLIAFRLLLRPGEALPVRAATVEMSGAFRPVSLRGGPDSYAGYLRGQGVALQLTPAWLRRELAPPPWAEQHYERLAERMSAILSRGFATRPDLAALYQAMMLGRKAGLTPAQQALFAASGTQHLFAINGLHLGIVALSLHALLKLLRCPPLAASALVLGVLWLDVQATGASPSALRAWLMVATVEAAQAFWLPINPLAALSVAAAALLARDPAALFSASFQMSFGVVAGLILLGVPYSGWLQRRYCAYPHAAALQLTRAQKARAAAQHHLLGAFGFGAAAAAVSAITGVEYFGRFAPGGLLANLLLMPLATLVIIAGCAAIVSGLLHVAAATLLFNSAARLLLQAIVAALQTIVQLPGASWTLHYRAAWIGPFALALLLATCLWGYAHCWRSASGGWTPPFLVATGALLLGGRCGPTSKRVGDNALHPYGISWLASAVDQSPPRRFSPEHEIGLRTRHGTSRQIGPRRQPAAESGEESQTGGNRSALSGQAGRAGNLPQAAAGVRPRRRQSRRVRKDSEANRQRARAAGRRTRRGERARAAELAHSGSAVPSTTHCLASGTSAKNERSTALKCSA
jgi:competence protein ComEC